MSTTLIFVYGTLKEGFPNFAINAGRRVPGEFRTREAFPLYVISLAHEDRAPWLMASPGQGARVRGQVFEVDARTLAAMDALEEVGLPQGYLRMEIELDRVDAVPGTGTAVTRAQAYLKAPDQLAHCLSCEGPYEAYTLALAEGYRLEPPPHAG